jgi:hypothetical protein
LPNIRILGDARANTVTSLLVAPDEYSSFCLHFGMPSGSARHNIFRLDGHGIQLKSFLITTYPNLFVEETWANAFSAWLKAPCSSPLPDSINWNTLPSGTLAIPVLWQFFTVGDSSLRIPFSGSLHFFVDGEHPVMEFRYRDNGSGNKTADFFLCSEGSKRRKPCTRVANGDYLQTKFMSLLGADSLKRGYRFSMTAGKCGLGLGNLDVGQAIFLSGRNGAIHEGSTYRVEAEREGKLLSFRVFGPIAGSGSPSGENTLVGDAFVRLVEDSIKQKRIWIQMP